MNNFLWRWLDPDATQHSRREPWTKIGFCNFDGKITFTARRRQLRLQRLEGQSTTCPSSRCSRSCRRRAVKVILPSKLQNPIFVHGSRRECCVASGSSHRQRKLFIALVCSISGPSTTP